MKIRRFILAKFCRRISRCVYIYSENWTRNRPSSAGFPCVLTQDAYHWLRNIQRVFLWFRTVFSFRNIRGFISFGKWRFFLAIRCKNWSQEISAYNLVNKLFKVVFLALLVGVQNMREIMLIQWLKFRPKLLKEWMTLIRRINRCPTIRKTDVFKLWKFRQNTYRNSRIWCSRILKHRLIDFMVRFVGEIKEAIFCLPLFIFIIYCKAFRFLATLSTVWETFLKSCNAVVIWQSAHEAYRVA